MSKKIIWLTSYPKSGNTWLRYLLSNYFFNKENTFNFDIKNHINKFPSDIHFSFLNEYQKNEIIKKPEKISKYWIKAQQQIIIKTNNVIFFKTHYPLLVLNNNYFTDEENTLAIIHIVRDPRDVVVSYANFLDNDYDKVIEFVTSKKLTARHEFKKHSLGFDLMGSWAFHYASWKTGLIKIPRILIRYEDLLDDVNKEFTYLIKFLSKILKFSPDNNQLKFSIKNSEFVTLSKYEKKIGFSESNLSNKLFFNKGEKKQWQFKLNTNQLKKIENHFHKEMIELGYINP